MIPNPRVAGPLHNVSGNPYFRPDNFRGAAIQNARRRLILAIAVASHWWTLLLTVVFVVVPAVDWLFGNPTKQKSMRLAFFLCSAFLALMVASFQAFDDGHAALIAAIAARDQVQQQVGVLESELQTARDLIAPLQYPVAPMPAMVGALPNAPVVPPDCPPGTRSFIRGLTSTSNGGPGVSVSPQSHLCIIGADLENNKGGGYVVRHSPSK